MTKMATNSVAFAFVSLLLQCCVVSRTKATFLNITTDQSSLLALKHCITHDPNNIIAKNWSSTTPVCSWVGVTCGSSHHRVTALNLSHMNLVGTIPPHIGNLSFLAYLNLRSNWFRASLPNEMVQLYRLKYVSLGFNNFTSEIPSWFVFLPKLGELLLYHNSFTGVIPPSLFNINSLQVLDISSNKLWGFLPPNFFMAHALQFVGLDDNKISGSIPSNIFNNSSLQTIGLNYNNLSGELPENIFNHLPQLKGLYSSRNQFSGKLPLNLFNCKQLQQLSLSYNTFTGTIPREIGNLTMLRDLALGTNNFSQGTIPHEIGNLQHLELLSIPFSNLIGNFPAIILNISTIKLINLNENFLSGNLPPYIGFALQNLQTLELAVNSFGGRIPNSLSNITMLIDIELSYNSFSGHIPNALGNLRNLEYLGLSSNNLTNEPSTPELSIINSLRNCRYLKRLELFNNPLNSILPISIGNLSNSLEFLSLSNCDIWGSIPTSIGNLSGLISLELDENQLIGIIPTEIGNMKELQALTLYGNKLQGSFPLELCHLKSIVNLYLGNIGLVGSIPTCLGNLTSLRELRIDSNAINLRIPSTLWGLSDLLVLDLSMNKLNGSLPLEIGNLKVLAELYLFGNHLSGKIPNTIGQLQGLTNLSLAQNEFEGPIPKSLSNMVSLEVLDLSKNNLSGVIPLSLMTLVYLHSFNVSFNKLEGEIPNGGPFTNFSPKSFMGNVALCGGALHLQFPKCKTQLSSKSSKTTRIVLKFVFPITIATILIILAYVLMKYQKKRKPSVLEIDTTMVTWTRISFLELQQATNGFSETNLLGCGSFGKVYNGILSNGINIAVKVFNLELEGAFKSFDAECEILCNVRHRNVVKIISSCANLDFKALVLSYMPNGSLEKWLHSHNHYLSIIQRLNIMIDVATALNYLHHECSIPIVHCDIKPSNVLLDEDMVGHLSDFGIGKLLNGGDSVTQTLTLATIGYMAPEYGLEGIVSRQGDVYSYGILLMETFTQKEPTNEMFHEGFSLRHWVQESYHHVIDVKLLVENGGPLEKKRDCLLSIMGLALECSTELPNERKDINAVLLALQKIKKRFLNEARVPRPSI